VLDIVVDARADGERQSVFGMQTWYWRHCPVPHLLLDLTRLSLHRRIPVETALTILR